MNLKPKINSTLRATIAIVMVLAIIYLTLPILYTFVITFDAREYLGRMPPPQLSFKWFQKFFTDRRFLSSIRVSLIIASITAAISTLVGLLAALAIRKGKWRGSEALGNLLLSPLMVPGVVKGFALLNFLTILGLKATMVRLLLGHLIITLPYTSRTCLAVLTKSSANLEYAASSLGANKFITFSKIILPLIRPGVMAGALFAFAMSLDNVALTIFLTAPGTETFPIALMSTLKAQITPIIAAGATVLIVFAGVMVILIERFIGIEDFTGMGFQQS